MKIQQTRNYDLFVNDATNRPITDRDRTKLRKLADSMTKYGFLPFPIIVRRVGAKLKVIDGQHRLAVAKQLLLPVSYVETDRDDIVIADCAGAQSAWNVFDYVASFAAQGKPAYVELLKFAGEYQLPVARCASILYGDTAGSGNAAGALKDGSFVIRDRKYAHRVAVLVNVVGEYVPWSATSNSINALSRFLRVTEFSDDQFIKRVRAHSHLLRAQATMELYSEMYEEVYNHASRSRIPLAFLAKEAATARNVVKSKSKMAA